MQAKGDNTMSTTCRPNQVQNVAVAAHGWTQTSERLFFPLSFSKMAAKIPTTPIMGDHHRFQIGTETTFVSFFLSSVLFLQKNKNPATENCIWMGGKRQHHFHLLPKKRSKFFGHHGPNAYGRPVAFLLRLVQWTPNLPPSFKGRPATS